MAELTITAHDEMEHIGRAARTASREVARATSRAKNSFLTTLADLIENEQQRILETNARDIDAAREAGRDEAFLDRLALTASRIQAMASGCRDIALLSDPIGEIVHMTTRPSGIQVGQMRVPLGVIGMIYEARPNVTIDAAALAVKSGNAVVLRGGSEALQTNILLWELVQRALTQSGLPKDAVQLITTADRTMVGLMITATRWIDVLVPRGGKSLIARLMAEATVPMIKHLDGICHTYVDESADLEMALKVVENAKTQRYAPCNATETLLVHKAVAFDFLPSIARIFHDKDVEMRCDERSRRIIEQAGFSAIDATEDDWDTEYNAPIIAIAVVNTFDEALDFIGAHSSHHTDAIITENWTRAQRFLREVDSASVMVNTSTRFADGFEYGLGAEIGISTDKLHARGPVGLEGLTSLKYIVLGHGECRH